MSMNREQKRMLKKQGDLNEDGSPARSARKQPQQRQAEERVGPGQFLHEVRGELRKVAWPGRAEVVNYSIVVFITVVLLTAMIFALDWVFGEGVLRLFET